VKSHSHLLVNAFTAFRDVQSITTRLVQEARSERGISHRLTALGLTLRLFAGAFIALYAVSSQSGTKARKPKCAPPINAEFLFYIFMTPQKCDAFVGDLEERYKLIHKKFGKGRADFWFWTQTVLSLRPIVWAWMKSFALKPVMVLIGWAVARGLLGHDSWLAALVELWKRVRS
jgi:hypothetical protein